MCCLLAQLYHYSTTAYLCDVWILFLIMLIEYKFYCYYLVGCTMFPHPSAPIDTSRVFPMGILAVLFFWWAGAWPAASTPNLEDLVIFDQGYLPLGLDKPISDCKAAVLVLVRPEYFISPVRAISGEHSPISPSARWVKITFAWPNYVWCKDVR